MYIYIQWGNLGTLYTFGVGSVCIYMYIYIYIHTVTPGETSVPYIPSASVLIKQSNTLANLYVINHPYTLTWWRNDDYIANAQLSLRENREFSGHPRRVSR